MLKILMTAFVTFAILSESVMAVPCETRNINYNPISDIDYSEREVEWYRYNVVGRHVMVKIEKCESIGKQPVQLLTHFYNADALKNFEFEEEFSTITETSFSTTTQISSKMMTTLAVQAKIPNASIAPDATISQVYNIENQKTYTSTQTSKVKVNYEVKEELVEGKKFALGVVGDVYKITWETWLWDDYWWGKYEVSGSRKSNLGYITVNPFVTIVFQNGGFVA